MLNIKNLELNRETLRSLDTKEQELVQGGGRVVQCSGPTASVRNTIHYYCC